MATQKEGRRMVGQKIKNKIEATDSSINKLLKGQKFTIDYFQREYRWEEKHIKLFVEDLITTFLKSYSPRTQTRRISKLSKLLFGSGGF